MRLCTSPSPSIKHRIQLFGRRNGFGHVTCKEAIASGQRSQGPIGCEWANNPDSVEVSAKSYAQAKAKAQANRNAQSREQMLSHCDAPSLAIG
jgi:hypothetical protein